MARNTQERYTVTAILEAQTAIHIGEAEVDAVSDMPLVRDGMGHFYIPGTSLAGIMLSWWKKETNLGIEAINTIWGKGKDDFDDGHASRLIISDAPIRSNESYIPEIRNHVGIDRVTGSASENIKFDRMVLPRGSCFDFSLELETDSHSDVPLKCLRLFLEETQIKALQIGGGTTRGLGEVILRECRVSKIDFRKKTNFLESLDTTTNTGTNGNIDITNMPDPEDIRNKPPEIIFSLAWKPQSVLFSKSSYDGISTDGLPLITTNGNKEVALLLPGSSIKGAIRGHAEKILRSLLDIEAPIVCNTGTSAGSFTNQIELPLINKLFGAVKKDKKDNSSEKGCLSCPDRHANIINDRGELITLEGWQGVLSTKNDTELNGKLKELGLAGNFRNSYHVAIDRWTGGAKENALFQILQPENFKWDNLTIRLDKTRIPENELIPAQILLLLTLNDIGQGDFALGFGAAKGFGRITITAIEVSGAEGLLSTTDTPGDLLKLIDGNNLVAWKQKWRDWISDLQNETSANNVKKEEGGYDNA